MLSQHDIQYLRNIFFFNGYIYLENGEKRLCLIFLKIQVEMRLEFFIETTLPIAFKQ